jgi:hypothetical protein
VRIPVPVVAGPGPVPGIGKDEAGDIFEFHWEVSEEWRTAHF